MRDSIQRCAEGDDSALEEIAAAICKGKIILYVSYADPKGNEITFLNFVLDDPAVEYIPIFSDQEEMKEFKSHAPVPDNFKPMAMDGNLFAATMDPEQHLMINPVSGGILFPAGVLKSFVDPARLPK